MAVLVLALVALWGALAGPVAAQEFAPALVFDMGGKFDKSFNEAAYNGAERFKKETGIAYREFEVTDEAQREQALRNMARRGSQITVGIGFAQATGMEKVAKEFPEPQVRHHRRGGGPAERPVDRLQGARGLLPRRDGRGHGVEDGQGRLRRAAWTSR